MPSPPRPAGQRTPADKTLAVRRRPDLRVVRTRHRFESAIVVKDPIAMKYHRLREDEYFVLQMLDGGCNLQQIQQAYQQQFAPQKVTVGELNRLLFRFHQNGLTISDAMAQGDRLVDRRRQDRRRRWRQMLHGILFIRFPGIDPDPLLRRLYPLVRPLLGRFGMLMAMALVLTAVVVLASRWPSFLAQFPAMNQWLQLRSVLILALVIGATKVLHELGHAVVCKHFGGECHQIGPLLMVFTPALYCDTSDSWMLANRWHRVAVGIAGIATEVLLAAAATLVWAMTSVGMVHYVAMNVMLVCSVSTVLFNANPLLRYDGYFVLSDWCDVPNLGERSRRMLATTLQRWTLGVQTPLDDSLGGTGRAAMLFYAVAATCYRWLLTLFILWLVSLALRPYELQSLGRLLAALAAGGLIYSLLQASLLFFRDPGNRRQVQMKRGASSLLVLSTLLAAAAYPLPAKVSPTGRLVPRHETPIYITTPGQLVQLHQRPGAMVQRGDALATLANPEVELQYLSAQGRYQTQLQIVQTLRSAVFTSPSLANELPGQEALLAELKTQFDNRTARRQGLTIRAPAAGVLIVAPGRDDDAHRSRRSASLSSDPQQTLVRWSGYPTDPHNQDCFLESGQELMSLVQDRNWDAELLLDQSQVERIAIDNQVELTLTSLPTVRIGGRVADISRAQSDHQDHARRRDDPQQAQIESSLGTTYVVRVELQPTSLPLVTGAQTLSRIEAQPISLLGRAARWLDSLLRFRS